MIPTACTAAFAHYHTQFLLFSVFPAALFQGFVAGEGDETACVGWVSGVHPVPNEPARCLGGYLLLEQIAVQHTVVNGFL